MSYLPFVDGLRAVAILAVVAFHALPWALPGGFAGVDVFFVISGFLITRFIAAELTDGSFSLLNFYVRRARRLLPAALVCFLVVAALSAFVLLPDAYWYFGRSLLAAVLMYANIFFYNTGGYFSAPSLEKPLLHTWSLAVEDQFYLTWPLLLVVLAPRIPRRALIALSVALIAGSLYYAEIKITKDPEFAFFQLPTRAWELLLGAVLALTASRISFPTVVAEALAAAGVVLIAASFVMLSPEAHFPGAGALPACLGTAAIIAASLNTETLVARALALRPVVFVGLISYSLYLWHWPLIALLSYWLEKPLSVAQALAVVTVSFGVAILSWRYVERPFRKGTGHGEHTAATLSPADWRFVGGVIAGVALVIGVAGALKIGKGFPERYNSEIRTVLEQMVTGNKQRGACDDYQNIFRNDDVCNFGRKKVAGESYEVALFGDSMADHWAPLVAKFAEEKNLAGRQVTNGGCGLLFGIKIPAWPIAKSRECTSYQQEAEKFIVANPGLKVAVISGFWEKWLGRVEHPEQRLDVPLAKTEAEAAGVSAKAFDKVLADTIKVFTDRGIKVLLIGQIPTYGTLPVRCLVSNLRAGGDPASCGMARSRADAELKRSDEALLRAARTLPNVSTSLPRSYMCQEKTCSLLLDGTMLYKNGGHVNQYGALLLRRFVEFPAIP
jgi:peptidoglycan/LPS O-acetylase OafA/YrhL